MAGFGETLKRERELREISLRQIAEATKINIRYLEALEENRFDVLPGGLFNKGFIRAYSHFIGIDSEAMVNSYLQELSARLQGAGAAPVRDQGLMHRPAGVPQRRAGSRPGDAAPERSASPAITFAPHPPRPAATAAAAAPRTDGGASPRAATPAGNADASRAARPAIDGIEMAAQATPRSSRALLWILSLVAAAGVLFLLLSLLRGATPSASRPADRPDPEGAGEEPGGSSALLPEMPQLSNITLGALTSAPPAAAPADGQPDAAARPSEAGSSEARPEAPPRPDRTTAPPPAAPPPAPGALGSDRSAVTGPMEVAIEASGRTFVQVVCDGREMLSRVMEAGETEEARCGSVVKISATDAGAARIAVNGSPCLPLGDPGTRAYGYTIRIDDYARICPPGGREADGRR